MFKKFCGKIKCLGRLGRACHCDDEEASAEGPSQPNRPRQSTHQNQGGDQRQAVPRNFGPQDNGEGQANQENEQTEENQQNEENEERENDRHLPSSKTSSKASSTGLTHAMNEAHLGKRETNNQEDPMGVKDEEGPQEGANSPRPSNSSSSRKRWHLQEEEDPESVEERQGSPSHCKSPRWSASNRQSKRPGSSSPSPMAGPGEDPATPWGPRSSWEGPPLAETPRPEASWSAPRKPTKEKIAMYRELGANRQAWIDDQTKPDCPIGRSSLTLGELQNASNFEESWFKEIDIFVKDPAELQGGDPASTTIPRGEDQYRYTRLSRFHTDLPENAWSTHDHLIGRGIIVGTNIERIGGQHWNVIAQAVYTNDYSIDTLRHVMFTNVVNDELAPYIQQVLFPRKGTLWLQAGMEPCKKFRHGSIEYQELLGTRLGKGVAALVLGAFDRGTMRITQIVVWSFRDSPQIRFEIEPIVPDPIALLAAAGLGSI